MIFVSLFFLALLIGFLLYIIPRKDEKREDNFDYPANLNARYTAEFGDEDDFDQFDENNRIRTHEEDIRGKN